MVGRVELALNLNDPDKQHFVSPKGGKGIMLSKMAQMWKMIVFRNQELSGKNNFIKYQATEISKLAFENRKLRLELTNAEAKNERLRNCLTSAVDRKYGGG